MSTKPTTVNKARKAQGKCSKCGTALPVGASYVWWSFAFGPRFVRCTKPECAPKPVDLTNNEHEKKVIELSDQLGDLAARCQADDWGDPTELAGEITALADEVREYTEELEGRLENIPDSLKEAEAGQTLTQRIETLTEASEALDEVATELESAEITDPLDDEAVKAKYGEDTPRAHFETDEEHLEAMRSKATEENDEVKSTAHDGLEGVSFE